MATEERSSTRTTAVDTSPSTLARVRRGLGAGFASYVGGYLLVVLMSAPTGVRSITGLGEGIPLYKQVGLLFYNAHYDAILEESRGGFDTLIVPHDYLGESSGLIVPGEFWFFVPILTLVVAGALLASRSRSVLGGGWVAVGYVPLVYFGAEFVSVTGDSFEVTPSGFYLITGAVYPVVCGILGGLLYSLVRRYRAA